MCKMLSCFLSGSFYNIGYSYLLIDDEFETIIIYLEISGGSAQDSNDTRLRKAKIFFIIDKAVTNAVEECIQKDVLKDILVKNRAEVIGVVLSCSREKYEKMLENESYEKGRLEGRLEGRGVGEAKLSRLIQCLLKEEKYGDIEKATVDAEYREQLYTAYDIS